MNTETGCRWWASGVSAAAESIERCLIALCRSLLTGMPLRQPSTMNPTTGFGMTTRAVWFRLRRSWMPADLVDVLDTGCGTGLVSLLLAEAGHRVTGVDLAPRMGVVLSRHLVWTLPDLEAALCEWVARLRPGGRLVLACWSRGGGGKQASVVCRMRPAQNCSRGTAESASRTRRGRPARSF